jgi:hypothetical protein
MAANLLPHQKGMKNSLSYDWVYNDRSSTRYSRHQNDGNPSFRALRLQTHAYHSNGHGVRLNGGWVSGAMRADEICTASKPVSTWIARFVPRCDADDGDLEAGHVMNCGVA